MGIDWWRLVLGPEKFGRWDLVLMDGGIPNQRRGGVVVLFI